MSDGRSGTLRRAGLALVVLLLLAPIVGGILLSSGGSSRPGGSRYRPLSGVASGASAAAAGQTVPPGPGALVAVLQHGTNVLGSPAGPRLGSLRTLTEYGSPQELWVVAVRPQWLGVITALAGNGGVGWIPRTSAALARVEWQLKVSLSARRLTVLAGNRVLRRYTVAVGSPDAPTPTGRFDVTDRLVTGTDAGPYGCCILALSAVAPHAIQGWSGGNRIAIHSTPDTASIGEAVSHGCLHVTLAEGRWLLAHIPVGTPTVITG